MGVVEVGVAAAAAAAIPSTWVIPVRVVINGVWL